VLKEELKPAVHSKCRGMEIEGVVLHHDNARPHMTVAVVEMVQKLKFEFLSHPVCSYLITIFSDHLKMHYVDADLRTMKSQGHGTYVASHTAENILRRCHQEAHGLR
jgi:hypothetical protein